MKFAIILFGHGCPHFLLSSKAHIQPIQIKPPFSLPSGQSIIPCLPQLHSSSLFLHFYFSSQKLKFKHARTQREKGKKMVYLFLTNINLTINYGSHAT